MRNDVRLCCVLALVLAACESLEYRGDPKEPEDGSLRQDDANASDRDGGVGSEDVTHVPWGVTACESQLSFAAFRNAGWTPSWLHETDQVAYNRPDDTGYYNVYVVGLDGRGEYSPTRENPKLPGKHAGSPDWHPSGKYIVLTAEKAVHPGDSSGSLPGFGFFNDLWLITPDGEEVFQLTDVANDRDHGVLLPHFSPDGTKLVWGSWTTRANVLDPPQAFGYSEIKIADFVDGASGPSITNVRTVRSTPSAFYETGGFSPDGRKMLITASFLSDPWHNQIFLLDLESGETTQLTEQDYNEHPVFTPDGETILWMTNHQATLGGTDWWLMDADGANKRRISHFNEPEHPQSTGSAQWAINAAWDPTGSWFIGGVQTNLVTQDGWIARVSCPESD